MCEPNYHTTKIIWKTIEMKKNIFMNLNIFMIFMNKPVYLGSSILECVKSNIWILVWSCGTKIRRKIKIMLHGCRQCHSLHKNKINLIDIAKDVTSNYELGRPFPREKK